MPRKSQKEQRRGLIAHTDPLQPSPSSFTVASTSRLDGHARHLVVPSFPPSVSLDQPPLHYDLFDVALGDASINSVDESPAGIVLTVKKPVSHSDNSNMPLITWREGYRQQYLDANLKLEGRGRFWDVCTGCRKAVPELRCDDCFGYRAFCQDCAVLFHWNEPLHWLERWNGNYFQRTNIRSLGLTIQLGHRIGDVCTFPMRGPKDFVVIAINGVHVLDINFCGCTGAIERYEQLLEMGWWPATPLDPSTAATFSVLRHFHSVNLRACTPATDYYRALEGLTNGAGIENLPDRLDQFMTMVREWRHIKMAKRAGRGHDGEGILGTKEGELTVPCRACPHPERNLPPDFQNAPESDRWLYTLHLSQDANFKQKGRIHRNDGKDPPLGPGWGTFVTPAPYHQFLSTHADEEEISHCVSFAAMADANKKRSKGLRATGIGSVSCSRHEMFRPNGIGDLQKGERFTNMDWIFLSSIIGIALAWLTVTYDIACQWSLNFFQRLNRIPLHLLPSSSIENIRFRVPKFHLPAHITACHAPYSLNYTKGVGRTDGEGVERLWSFLNKVARSVSMMRWGGRQDTLDDFCNFSNWRKTVNLGNTLLKKLSVAIPDAVIHHRAYQAFTNGMRAESADSVDRWEKWVIEWEAGGAQACPYDLPAGEYDNIADVKRQLAEEEHRKVEEGHPPPVETTPSGFLIEGLAIEEAQRILQLDIKKKTTTIQATKLQTRRTTLLKRITQLRKLQKTYMPNLRSFFEQNSDVDKFDKLTSTPELIPLHLPSSFTPDVCLQLCTHDIASIEERLRLAQANDALAALRQQLRTRVIAYKHKARNIASQREFTRSRELERAVELRIITARLQYTAARSALLSLRGSGSWEEVLRELKPEDIRGLNERALNDEEMAVYRRTRLMAGLPEDPTDEEEFDNIPTTMVSSSLALGEGQRTLSWIWYSVSDSELKGTGVHDSLRVEWLKCRARAQRWQEEILLIEEEMRRSVAYCHWKEKWWLDRVSMRSTSCSVLQEGIRAYALQQNYFEKCRGMLWIIQWAGIRERARIVCSQLGTFDRETADSEDVSLPTMVVELLPEEESDDLAEEAFLD